MLGLGGVADVVVVVRPELAVEGDVARILRALLMKNLPLRMICTLDPTR